MPQSPGGFESGRTHIRVLPDTSQFKRRTEAALATIEHRVKVRVPLVLKNADGFKRRVAAVTRDRSMQVAATVTGTVRAETRLQTVARDRTSTIHVRLKEAVQRRGSGLGSWLAGGFSAVARMGVVLGGALIRGMTKAVTKGAVKIAGLFGDAVQSAVRMVVDHITTTLSKLGDALGPIGEAASAIVTGIIQAIITMTILGAIATAVLGAVAALAAITAVALGALPGLFAVVGLALVATDENLRSGFLASLSEMADTLRTLAMPVIEEFQDLLRGIADDLQPGTIMYERLADAFEAAAKNITPFFLALRELVLAILPPLTDAMNKLAYSTFWDKIAVGMRILGAAIGEFFSSLADDQDLFARAFVAVADGLRDLLPHVAEFLAALAAVAPAAMATFVDVVTRILNVLSDPETLTNIIILSIVFAKFFAFMVEVAAGMMNLVMSIGRGIHSIGQSIKEVFVDLGEWYVDAWGDYLGWLRGMAGQLVEWWFAAKRGWEAFWDSIYLVMFNGQLNVTSVWDDMIAHLRTALHGFLSWLGQLPSKLARIFLSALRVLGQFGSRLRSYFLALPDKIEGWLGDLSYTLYGAGQDLIGGLIDGILSEASGVTSAISSVTDLWPFSTSTSTNGPTPRTALAPRMVAMGQHQIDATPVVEPFSSLGQSIADATGLSRITVDTATSHSPPDVRVNVYLGDQPIRDLVRTEISYDDRRKTRAVRSGYAW
ncbi:hypothetical protein [Haloglycomyces albus]|uniref:hypothetical protein n=1 Tax=Haloglycomyces albus TaxID=526067 RepID=UPI0004B2800E|nr:hypothetical protein [Haloglycomyces albus]